MKYKKYKITFYDPTGDSGWHTEDELDEFTPEECVIEAYVFNKGKKFITTFASYSKSKGTDELAFADVNAIPRGCIIQMEKIK